MRPTTLVVCATLLFVTGLVAGALLVPKSETARDTGLPPGKIRVLDTIPINLVNKDGKDLPTNGYVEILCIDGYKYLHLGQHPVSGINQMLRWDEAKQRTMPVRCGDFTISGLHDDDPAPSQPAPVSPKP